MRDDLTGDVAKIRGIDAVARILEVVCRVTGMRFSAVARVTADRWVACAVRDELGFGLGPGDEFEIERTFCREVRDQRSRVVFNSVSLSPAWSSHPLPPLYGIESYISVPIVTGDGHFFGTLCALDTRSSTIESPELTTMVELFAELIASHIDAHERLSASETRLADELRTAKLREQFIAVLGHDLRNPVAAIGAGTRLLAKSPLDERGLGIVAAIGDSVRRMSRLIDDVMDFARGRLGGGLPVRILPDAPLGATLGQVVEEVAATAAGRRIDAAIPDDLALDCDPDRIAQLLTNLLVNAITHGAEGEAVTVRAGVTPAGFELAVGNGGTPIPPAEIERLFQPFERGSGHGGGIGLGLYIASEIATAHGGRIDVASDERRTTFTLRIPRRG